MQGAIDANNRRKRQAETISRVLSRMERPNSRFNPPGPEIPRYELFDQIWVSQALAGKVSKPMIDRRTKHGGDGSDHDPAWIELEL